MSGSAGPTIGSLRARHEAHRLAMDVIHSPAVDVPPPPVPAQPLEDNMLNYQHEPPRWVDPEQALPVLPIDADFSQIGYRAASPRRPWRLWKMSPLDLAIFLSILAIGVASMLYGLLH
jgi:hypothetical protein